MAFSTSSRAILGLLLITMASATSARPSWSDSFSARFASDFDPTFQSASAAYGNDLDDWKSLKAQGIQESGLRADAVSPAGAVGIMQFMPGTWADISRQLGWRNVDPRSPQHSIVGAAFYMRQLRNLWKRDRSPAERQALALPSYNAGAGWILKAQALCNGARFWDDIKPCLIFITGAKNARETIGYGVSIAKWRRMLE